MTENTSIRRLLDGRVLLDGPRNIFHQFRCYVLLNDLKMIVWLGIRRCFRFKTDKPIFQAREDFVVIQLTGQGT